MQAVILVGGLGTRLRPLTSNRPKPLLPIANKPFIIHQLQRLREQGVDEIVLAVQYLADQFERLLGDGSDFGLRLRIVEEPEPRGTAGAVKHVVGLLRGPTVILNGDTVTDLDLRVLLAAHQRNNAALTLALTEVADPTASGMVECDADGRVHRFVEKPRPDQVTTNRVNAGSYVIDPSVLDLIQPDQPASLERDLFPQLINSGAPVYGMLSDAYVGDFGTPATYLDVHEAILRGVMHIPLPGSSRGSDIWYEGSVEIDPSATLVGPLLLGAGVCIGAGARISGPTVLGAGCIIEANAQITRSVLWNEVQIGPDAIVQQSILGHRCMIGQKTTIDELTVLGDGCTIGGGNNLARSVRLWPGIVLPDNAISF